MADFSSRFKRVTASGTAKRYIDRTTGKELSYRQAMKAAKAGGLTRKEPTPIQRARVKAGIERRATIRNTILKRRGLTGADVKDDPQLAAYIKHMTAQSKRKSAGFTNRNRISREQFEDDYDVDLGDAEEDYAEFVATLGQVGGFIG